MNFHFWADFDDFLSFGAQVFLISGSQFQNWGEFIVQILLLKFFPGSMRDVPISIRLFLLLLPKHITYRWTKS